jgi:hypothetical protein
MAANATAAPVTHATSKPSNSQGCDVMCTYNGESYSCKQRILFASTHQAAGQPDSCAQAHNIVAKDCPACSACPVADLGCIDAHPTTAPPPSQVRLQGGLGSAGKWLVCGQEEVVLPIRQ